MRVRAPRHRTWQEERVVCACVVRIRLGWPPGVARWRPRCALVACLLRQRRRDGQAHQRRCWVLGAAAHVVVLFPQAGQLGHDAVVLLRHGVGVPRLLHLPTPAPATGDRSNRNAVMDGVDRSAGVEKRGRRPLCQRRVAPKAVLPCSSLARVSALATLAASACCARPELPAHSRIRQRCVAQSCARAPAPRSSAAARVKAALRGCFRHPRACGLPVAIPSSQARCPSS